MEPFALVRQAVREDAAFATELATAVAAVKPADVSTNSPYLVGNTAGGSIAGRDINTNTSNSSTSTTHNKKSSYGGLIVGVVVIVALVVAFVVGNTLLGAVKAASLSGSSTCADYLQSTDEASKAAVMKKLYLAKDKPHLAADPFINQNTEYFCGNSPKTTLDRLATVRNDG